MATPKHAANDYGDTTKKKLVISSAVTDLVKMINRAIFKST